MRYNLVGLSYAACNRTMFGCLVRVRVRVVVRVRVRVRVRARVRESE